METPAPHQRHVWYSPEDCAALLEATKNGAGWRAKCPAHGGDNPNALKISQGHDKHGNPVTMLHCFAHQCKVEDICAAMGIEVRNLFCMHPDYYDALRHTPPAKSPAIAKLRKMPDPTPEEIAQILLEEMIVSDPQWIEECQPARAKMWELACASPRAREALTRALREAHILPSRFWALLAGEREGAAYD